MAKNRFQLRGRFFVLCYNEPMDANMTTIITSIIAAAGGIAGAYLAVRKSDHEREIKDVQREQKQSDRLDRIDENIDRLSKKVDIHNGYAEKFGEVATQMTAMAKDIEYLKKRS